MTYERIKDFLAIGIVGIFLAGIMTWLMFNNWLMLGLLAVSAIVISASVRVGRITEHGIIPKVKKETNQ